MASYIDDRIFTNYIHNHVALSKIYKPLGWEQVTLNQQYAENIDLQDGIDYIGLTEKQIRIYKAIR